MEFTMENTFSGKTIVITGATSGIGLATARLLAAQGADLIGIGRSPERCRETASRLRGLNPDIRVDYLVADLSLQGEVRGVADEIRDLLALRGKTGLDGLVNNAGTFTFWLTYTPEGFEMQWAVNHLAPFLLTNELLPLLGAAPTARVVTVSSGSHYNTRLKWDDLQLRRHYNGLLAYNQTKLANVLFTLELNRRLGISSAVRAFAADPGLVKTEIGYKGTPAIVRWVWQRRAAAGDPPETAARGIVYLLGEPSIQGTNEVYWKAGAPKAASRNALDAVSAGRLWQISEKMCGISQEN
jgi:NAD(P)-dependent dehydrogenase (short-subunit alcohol dehydrogenase family)